MADRLFGVLRHQCFQFRLGPLMIQERLPGAAEQPGEFGPRIRRAHVNDPNRLDPGLRRLDTKEVRGLATLDTAPELAFCSDNEVLIEWIGMGGDRSCCRRSQISFTAGRTGLCRARPG